MGIVIGNMKLTDVQSIDVVGFEEFGDGYGGGEFLATLIVTTADYDLAIGLSFTDRASFEEAAKQFEERLDES